MIDEIAIIGVTEWTVDGLAAKEFRNKAKMPLSHQARLDGGTGRAGWGREELEPEAVNNSPLAGINRWARVSRRFFKRVVTSQADFQAASPSEWQLACSRVFERLISARS